MRTFVGMLAALALAVGVLVPVTISADLQPAAAASAAEFDPGYIISDENFYAGSAMTEGEIQSFLNAKSNGCASGYTCLKDYRVNTYTRSADAMCSSYSGAGNESAARVIAKVATACGINPRVLLVTLEKEQGLVSTRIASTSKYDRAMGYACPDTADCDTAFFGFYNQVYKSAWQFKRYANPPGTNKTYTWYPVGATTNVAYHPNAACGSSPVRIRNAATAALYYYTPYQPNASALANLYGTGDACGAYGNRNFWRMYTDWFGSTVAPRYGSLDSATGVYKGIQIGGWSIDPATTASSYIWVNIDGQGGPYVANKPLGWFNTLFPGYGANHGFSETIPASVGDHEVCVYGTLGVLACKWVTVPYGNGSVDTATGTWGGVALTGWAVDHATTAPAYIWVNVDGVGGAHLAAGELPWINSYFPGAGSNHGFSVTVPAAPGPREVCVYGVYGTRSQLISCSNVVVPRGTGALDSVVPVTGGVVASGWSADYTSPASSFIWVNVDGVGGPFRTNTAKTWLPNLLPGIGVNNGFDVKVPAKKGAHQVCVYGAVSLLRCETVTVAKAADGHVDSIEAVAGGVRLRGWSVDLTTSAPSWLWVNFNGTGGPYKADAPLSWFDRYYPGSGPNHGFDITIPKPPGNYEVCVHGTEELLRCERVTVS
ncbi:hypothetical protein EV379_0648 [Microterricola gilva]|uniref:LGFP repeat-containing protein n=1 Tax=Microterricola gilva TaxID=393267 RepID=A0A4Q8AKB6_9MICO|nr:hypothetical protein [Microterricola gilva]RZU64353.1 hypothetical protein EV379_0648 [Microterricola gilva]